MLVHVVLVLLLVNVFTSGQCVARRECDCFFAGDSASSAVVVIMWCCEGECGASTTGKQDACAAAGEFCLLLVNVLLEYTALVLLLWL